MPMPNAFVATIIGVFGFYIAMLSIGIYEGAMVWAGWPYEAARDWMADNLQARAASAPDADKMTGGPKESCS